MTRQGQKSQKYGKLDMYLPDYLQRCRESGPDGDGDQQNRLPCQRCQQHYCRCNGLLKREHYAAWDELQFGTGAEDQEALRRLRQQWVNVSNAAQSKRLHQEINGKFTFYISHLTF